MLKSFNVIYCLLYIVAIPKAPVESSEAALQKRIPGASERVISQTICFFIIVPFFLDQTIRNMLAVFIGSAASS